MRFIIVKNGIYNFDTIRDVIQSLVGNSIKAVKDDSNVIVYHNYSNDDEIRKTLSALETELLTNMYAYISGEIADDRIEEALGIAKMLINNIPNGVYNFKEALLHSSKIENKEAVLDYILKYTGISEDFIKDFVNCDLNVSKASKEMFIHRNTMIYKLDKLSSISGFDLRSFKDAYILYMLINNK